MIGDSVWTALALCALIAGHCNAQCNNATTTIRGSADTKSLSACRTFTGVIAVATDSEPVIELSGVEKIEGDFIAKDNPKINTLASDTLVEVTGKVEWSNLPYLANITLPVWDSAGIVILNRLPSPTYVDFQQKGQQVSEIYITNVEYVSFTGISGLSLAGAQIDVLEIVDNPYMQFISFLAGNITGRCKITGNGADLKLQLPNLTYAYSLEIDHATEIMLPMLSSVTNGINISLSDAGQLSMSELTYVGGDFVISNNPNLDALEFGELGNIQGDLEITANDDLKRIDGMPYLSSISGNLNLSGTFESINLPALGIVRNDITIETTGSLDCASVPYSLGRGNYSCLPNGTATNAATATETGKPQKDDFSGGAIAGIAVGAVAFVALIAGVGFFVWKRQRRQKSTNSNQNANEVQAAPKYQQGGSGGETGGERKDNYGVEYYGTQSPHHGGPEKFSIHRGTEVGRGTSGEHVGPEGRHEMFDTQGSPAAHELHGHQFEREA